jgi:hypothetical protein
MGRPCTICLHAERAAIEAELEAGQPLRDIAAEYGASKTALHRHWHVHRMEPPLASVGKPHGHSGTRGPVWVRWGLVVAVGDWRGGLCYQDTP